jgi:predicted Fe-Mo cluster-binding NifX family protein
VDVVQVGNFGREEENKLKIAISTDNNSVSEHFGRCPEFTVIIIENKQIIEQKIIDNPGHQPGFLPEFLAKLGVQAIIAGGMGQRALDLFAQQNIKPILGISGKIEDVIKQLLEDRLVGGESSCSPGVGKGYGLDKTECTHSNSDNEENCHHEKTNDHTKSDRICITSQGDNLEATIDPRFGRCAYFIFVDPVTLEHEAIANPNKDLMGGAGIQSGQLVVEKKVAAVLTGHVGPNALKVLKESDVKIIDNVSGTVQEAIRQYDNLSS